MTYRLVATRDVGMPEFETVEHTGKSWEEVAHLIAFATSDGEIGKAENIVVFRERDDQIVLRYDKDGFDL